MAGRNQVVVLTPAEKQVRKGLLLSVEKYSEKLERLVPRTRSGQLTMDAAYLIMSLELHLTENPKLLECSASSIVKGMLRVAQTGLIPGNSCDLLPFGKACQFSPRYNGIAQLALASGVRAINVGVVREGDYFEYKMGSENWCDHKVVAKSTAPITYGWADAQIKPGAHVVSVMTREMIDAHRRRYSKQWWEQGGRVIPLEEIPWYGKKTPLRQMTPMLPQNPRLAAAMVYEREAEEGIAEDEELEEIEAAAEIRSLPQPELEERAAAPQAAPARVGGPREGEDYQDDSDIY